jgi:hypothetical protein
MKISLVAAVTLALVLAAPVRADGTDSAFLNAIYAQGINMLEPIQQAHAVRGELESHPEESFAGVVRGVAEYDRGMIPSSAEFFVATAIQTYCPQYSSLIGE